MKFKLSIFAIIAVLQISISNSENLQSLEIDRQVSNEGFITLSWNDLNLSSPVEVQLARDLSFNQLVRKINLFNQNSIHMSGLSNGSYYVRLMDDNANIISDPVSFSVEHRQLGSAVKLFALGAALFAFLIAAFIRFSNSS